MAFVVGFDPITRVWAAGRRSVDGLIGPPSLEGELLVDEGARAAAATDFGHIVHQEPQAVLKPGSAGDIAAMVRFCDTHLISIAMRGQGHSTYGQAQAPGGVVVDISSLDTVHHVGPDRVVVDAGARWSAVLAATLPRGVTPPVLTDYLELSVGGTLSVGGIGGASSVHGAQTDNVLELEVVTGTGRTATCSPTREPELFEAVLGGFGQCAVIIRATLRLVTAPTHARRYQLYYRDLRAFTADQRRVLAEGRFAYLEGQVQHDPSRGWRYMLEATAFFTPPHLPDDPALLGDLGYERGSEEITDLSYYEFLDRLAPLVAYLVSSGEWWHPHPWSNVFLPDSAVDSYVDEVVAQLRPDDIGSAGVVLLYPVRRDRLATPLLRVPDEPVTFLFALLRMAPPDLGVVRAMIDANRALYDQARAVGGTAYPVGTIPFSRADWEAHFGAAWTRLAAAKDRYDPRHVLAPGQRMF